MIIKYSDLTKNIYRPTDIAKMLGCTVVTVQNYCNQGKIKSYRNIKNRRQIDKEELINFLIQAEIFIDDSEEVNNKKDVIYARVSTHKQAQRGDLDRQVEKISTFAITKNPKNLVIYKEVGSGLNDNRKKLLEIIELVLEDKINRIFVLYKDRLTRFGFNYLQTICKKHNVEIVIVSQEIVDKTLQEELAEDIIAIIHSFSGKLYGMRKTIKDTIDKELQDVSS